MLREYYALSETCYIRLYMGISGEHLLSLYLNRDEAGILSLLHFKEQWNYDKHTIIEQYYRISSHADKKYFYKRHCFKKMNIMLLI